jgi:ferredoxin
LPIGSAKSARSARVFTDSAPVLEVELAARSGLGWRGKHTLALSREGGSMYFLGELFVDIALPHTPPAEAHCGSCTACIEVCPTRAIVAPYRLDARRCISYLTIEHDGPIPVELRPLIGNRIYGCDDCQLVCPWNKYARTSPSPGSPCVTGSTTPTSPRCSGGRRASSTRGCRGARSGESATSGGRATWRWRSATRRTTQRSSPRSKRAPTTPRRSCASTSRGRWVAKRGQSEVLAV